MPVLVSLESVSLANLRNDLPAVRAAMRTKAAALYAELGAGAWVAGRSENGMGQLNVHVTPQGLDALVGSNNAVSVFPGRRWHESAAFGTLNGANQEVKRLLSLQGHADVEVVLNIDGLEVDLTRTGATAFRAASAAATSAGRRMTELLSAAGDDEIPDRISAAGRLRLDANLPGGLDPRLTMRATRQGVLRLANSPAVRSIQPVGFVDRRAMYFDTVAAQYAERDGKVDVLITLRNPYAQGALSGASIGAVKRTHLAAAAEVLADAGAVGTITQDLTRFGTVAARLTTAQLLRLRDGADPRLLSIRANKIVATSQLAVSTTTMNMPSAWNVGFRASGQHVIVLDSGVQANHPFVAPRVALEGCYGTTLLAGSVQYDSPCPQADANGDSPLGLVGSAAPPFGMQCSSQNPSACTHGTHVAGIAAGRNEPGVPPGVQGTAPDSRIIAIQVMSFDRARVAQPGMFDQDFLQVLQVAADAAAGGTPATNTHTINVSLGGALHSGPCVAPQYADMITAVQQLRSLGMPVIVAAGNNGSNTAITFPACLPGAIKVSAARNDGVGNTRSSFSNIVDPAGFPGETFWLAPGGGDGTSIQSSVINGLGFQGFSGTSMAAPHIAGLYATAKSVNPDLTVQDATDWFIANGSVSVPIVTGAQTINTRRILLPAF